MTAEAWRAEPISRAFTNVRRVAVTWESLVFLAAFLVVATSHTRSFNTDGFLALSGGREISMHWLPSTDSMTVMGAGKSWIDQQWLGQLILYWLWEAGGYPAVALATAGLTALGYAVLCRVLLERGASPRRAVKWTTLAFAGALVDVSARTQDFAYPLFAVLLMLVLRDTGPAPSNRKMLGWLGLLVVWANLHGSVLVGVGLLGCHCLFRAIRSQDRNGAVRYAVVGCAAPLTIFATPYGLSIIHYYRAVIGNSAIRAYSSEWQPATPTNLAAIGYLAVVAAVAFVVVRAWRRGVRPDLALCGTTILFALAGFTAIRWAAWASFLAVVLATDVLNASGAPNARRLAPSARLWLAAGAAATILVLGFAVASDRTFTDSTPLGAMDAAAAYAASHPQTRVLGDDVSSSALLWMHPELRGRVAFDGRLEVFDQGDVRSWSNYVRVKPGSMGLTTGYQVFLASSSNRRLIAALKARPGLSVVYDGSDGVVIVRS
jgi:hypothetical protein